MSEEEKNCDSLGGTEELPSTISLSKFVACRSQEIQQMKSLLLSQSGTKLVFQTLPKHMRRRAMSHNAKRLPRRLRQIHINQMNKSGMPAKQKRPSRKYRRRPRNLKEEYGKRSNKKYKWLQTHIWHAKRFHMVEKWGYKLPCHPNDKAFRACYRAATQHCLLQDISYINCIEISGNKSVIIETIKPLCRDNVNLSVGAKAFVHGNREGKITLFETEITPDKAIGEVNYHWEPNEDIENSKLWLWVHAAFYDDVLNILVKSFNLHRNETKEEKMLYINYSNNTRLKELAGELNRFRLTGPLSNTVLQDALVILNNNEINSCAPWLRTYLNQPNYEEITENQYAYWKSLSNISSLSEISPHTICSFIVDDPRLNLPKIKSKSVPQYEKYEEYTVTYNISSSLLWNEFVRKKVNENMISNSKIIELQSNLLVPGSDLKGTGAMIPIILIQRPGCRTENISIGSGWDMIIPSAWARPFWTALIMRGARVGGLRESECILFEMGKSHFLHPDTKAGMEEERQISNKCIETFFRKPPNKRVNYNKFSIVSPFIWNWKLLIMDWNPSSAPVDEFVVLKDLKILNAIDSLLKSKTKYIPELPRNCLVPIKLECEKRGSPLKFAIICLPKLEREFRHLVLEKSCEDKHEQERKELRRSHKILLKRMKKQRKQKPHELNLIQNHKEVYVNYMEKIRSLWLPEPTTIRWSCSREVIGFVTQGGFSFSHGKSFATGYITANSLSSLVSLPSKNNILFRNTNTRLYRVAKLSVIVE